MANQQRAANLVKVAGEISKREALDLARRDWSNAMAKRVALARVKSAQEEVKAIIQAFESARPANTETRAALDAQYEAALEAIALVLRTAASSEMRLGQLQGVRGACAEHLDDIASFDRAEPSSRTREAAAAASHAKTAVKGMKAFADDPFGSLDGATKFWNKTWQKLSSTRFTKLLSKLTVREGWVLYDELFATNRIHSE